MIAHFPQLRFFRFRQPASARAGFLFRKAAAASPAGASNPCSLGNKPLTTYGAPSGLQPISPKISASFFRYSACAGRFSSSSAQIAAARSSLSSGSRTAMRSSACLRRSPAGTRLLDEPPQRGVGRARPVARSRADHSRDSGICARSQAFRHKRRWRRSVRRRRARRRFRRADAPCSSARSSDAPCSCAPSSDAPCSRAKSSHAPCSCAPSSRRALQLRRSSDAPCSCAPSSDAPCSCARRATRPAAAPRRATRPAAAPKSQPSAPCSCA